MKVTIIGASTAGLFAAYLLAKEGVEVELFEKADCLGWPPRTLIVTSTLKEVLGFDPDAAIVNKIKYFELFSKTKSARLELNSPDLIVKRKELVCLLAQMADGAGARVAAGQKFTGYTKVGRKILVSLKDMETGEERRVMTDILVGADGAMSAVGRLASRNGHNLVSLLQARVILPGGGGSDTCQVWFDSDQTKYFYWLIPESGEVSALGLIADSTEQARAWLTEIIQGRKLEPLEFQEAMVPLYRFDYTNGVYSPDRNVFVIGDAAAHVKATTQGGMVTGLRGARELARAILQRKKRPRFGAMQSLKLELDLHLVIRRLLNQFRDEDYDELISLIDGDLKKILEERTRDELIHFFLRLILKKPGLIGLGMKSLVRSII